VHARRYRRRFPLFLLCLAAPAAPCGVLASPEAAAESPDEKRSDTLAPIVVTATMQHDPLTVVADPKAPRQPVPASDGADFLKTIPGFATIRKGGSNGDPLLRGMAGSRLNILLDGGQIAGGCPSRMDPPTAYIAPELFDRVIVIKGPQSVVHGPGSSAGTILFERTHQRPAAPTLSFDGSLLGGSWGRNDQMLDLRAAAPQGYFDVAANHTHAQDYADGNGDAVHSSYDRWNADVTAGWTPDDDTRLELGAGRGDGRAAYAFSMMDGAQFLRESATLKFERTRISEVFDKLEIQAAYHYADHVMDNYTLRDPDPQGPMPMAMASDVDRRTLGGRIAGTFRWGDALQLVAGADASGSTHSGRNGGPPGSMMGDYRSLPRERDARMSDVGAFGELSWSFAPRRRLISGLRLDRAHVRGYALPVDTTAMHDMGMPGAGPTVDLSREATLRAGFVRYERDLENTPATFYAGVGRVERFPDYWELFGQHADKNAHTFSALAPETTTQLDVGLQYDVRHTQAWISAYAGRVDDFILFDYSHGMGGGAARNVRARIAGAEAGIAHAFGARWKADATLAYAWGANLSQHRPLPQMPPLEARFGLAYDTGTWSLGALWRVAAAQHRVAAGQGNIVGQDLGPSGGFGVFSLNGGYRFGHGIVLSAGIDNLFDKTYAEHVNAANEGLAGYVNTRRVNEPGRTAWLKLALHY